MNVVRSIGMRMSTRSVAPAVVALVVVACSRERGPTEPPSRTGGGPPAAALPPETPSALGVDASAQAPLSAQLALLRAHDQTRYEAPPAVMAAARDVFAHVDFVGRTAGEVKAMLGPPVREETRGGADRWHYEFHDGESGVFRILVLEGGVVRRVEVVKTL